MRAFVWIKMLNANEVRILRDRRKPKAVRPERSQTEQKTLITGNAKRRNRSLSAGFPFSGRSDLCSLYTLCPGLRRRRRWLRGYTGAQNGSYSASETNSQGSMGGPGRALQSASANSDRTTRRQDKAGRVSRFPCVRGVLTAHPG
jgi:hypothetical protein